MLAIIQFSPPRSGSTLCYNAIKWLAPERTLKKTHGVEYRWFLCPIITTLRDPFDSVVSACQVHGEQINDENVTKRASRMKTSYDGLKRLKFFPRVLVLQYDEFYDDYDYLFDKIASFLNVEKQPGASDNFRAEYNVERLYSRTKDARFDEYDKDTHIHGSHISKDRGLPGKGQRLTASQREIVKSILEI